MLREIDRKMDGVKTFTRTGAECFLYTNEKGFPCASGYIKNRQKPAFRFRYMSIEDAESKIIGFLNRVEANAKADKQRKIEDKKVKKELFETIKIGSIFVSSWGYDQTNVDAYQVIEKKGSATVILQEIKTETISDSEKSMSCQVIPAKNGFLSDSKPFEKRINRYGININSCSSASLWNGEKSYYRSWYA